MNKPSDRSVAATAPLTTTLAWGLTALLSLVLLLAPHAGHSAAVAGDPAVVGRWISDKNDPALDYAVTAGATPARIQLLVPAKAVGRKQGEVLTLERAGPNRFETLKGSSLQGSFVIKGPGHAEFKAVRNTDQSFTIIDQLLARP